MKTTDDPNLPALAKEAPTGMAPPSRDTESAPIISRLGPDFHKPTNPDVQAATTSSAEKDSARHPESAVPFQKRGNY